MSFQKLLLGIAYDYYGAASIAQCAGVRRETLWRYKTGAAKAPLEALDKIMGLLGAKLAVVPNTAS
jgi:hypothetical protein